MKKILVTGAGGSIGKLTIKELLKMKDVEITALDLRTKRYHKNLRKYRKQINIVYGDITDANLVADLVKESDYIIHLAGIMPPLANLKEVLLNDIDYKGTENILKAISYYNPDCFLVYPSTTSIYNQNKDNIYTVDSKVSCKNNDFYSQYKLKTEKVIQKKINNYVIYRLPLVLAVGSSMFYNIKNNINLEFITDQDVAMALVKSISHCKKINQKVYNLTGGENCRCSFSNLITGILKTTGLNLRYLYALIFLSKNYNIGYYSDSNIIQKELKLESENLDQYFSRISKKYKYRIISKLLAKPFIYFINLKYNKKENN